MWEGCGGGGRRRWRRDGAAPCPGQGHAPKRALSSRPLTPKQLALCPASTTSNPSTMPTARTRTTCARRWCLAAPRSSAGGGVRARAGRGRRAVGQRGQWERLPRLMRRRDSRPSPWWREVACVGTPRPHLGPSSLLPRPPPPAPSLHVEPALGWFQWRTPPKASTTADCACGGGARPGEGRGNGVGVVWAPCFVLSPAASVNQSANRSQQTPATTHRV